MIDVCGAHPGTYVIRTPSILAIKNQVKYNAFTSLIGSLRLFGELNCLNLGHRWVAGQIVEAGTLATHLQTFIRFFLRTGISANQTKCEGTREFACWSITRCNSVICEKPSEVCGKMNESQYEICSSKTCRNAVPKDYKCDEFHNSKALCRACQMLGFRGRSFA
ncbi:hypothetical protein O181_103993 [Austropuccinia psidii MF-1]|uniref:Uncharacterized protein n=1 Tax=Austropuccinia psidii MF-1 TaxID=1389203 RepID=A0A9Q3JJB2_9BASI|nr:hypothetical protein [Austropuccinia psidii MF-1]